MIRQNFGIRDELSSHYGMTRTQKQILDSINDKFLDHKGIKAQLINTDNENKDFAIKSVYRSMFKSDVEDFLNETASTKNDPTLYVWRYIDRKSALDRFAEADFRPVIGTKLDYVLDSYLSVPVNRKQETIRVCLDNGRPQEALTDNASNLERIILSILNGIYTSRKKPPKEQKQGKQSFGTFQQLADAFEKAQTNVSRYSQGKGKQNEDALAKAKIELDNLRDRLERGEQLIKEWCATLLLSMKFDTNVEASNEKGKTPELTFQIPQIMMVHNTNISGFHSSLPRLDNVNGSLIRIKVKGKTQPVTRIDPNTWENVIRTREIYTDNTCNYKKALNELRTDTENTTLNTKNNQILKSILQKHNELERALEAIKTKFNEDVLNNKEFYMNNHSTLSSLMSRVARINNFACTGRWFCPECGKEMESSKCCNSCGYTC